MRRVDYSPFLRLINRTETAFNVERHRGDIALSFGRERPDKQGEYTDLDVIAMALVDRLTRFFQSRRDAAEIVRAFWPHWLLAVVRAQDAKKNDASLFYIGARDFDGRKSWSASAPSTKSRRLLLAMPADERPTLHFYVDIWKLVTRRARGGRARRHRARRDVFSTPSTIRDSKRLSARRRASTATASSARSGRASRAPRRPQRPRPQTSRRSWPWRAR